MWQCYDVHKCHREQVTIIGSVKEEWKGSTEGAEVRQLKE